GRFEILKASHVSAGSSEAGNDAAFDRLGGLGESFWDLACKPVKLRHYWIARSDDGIRRGLNQLRCEPFVLLGVALAPTIIDAEVAAVFPAQFAKRPEKGSDARLARLISRSIRAKQDADTRSTLDLLRPRHHGPCPRAANPRDELAPPHASLPKEGAKLPRPASTFDHPGRGRCVRILDL